MRIRSHITSIALGLALLIATALGIGYASLRSEVHARRAKTARFCSEVIQEMRFFGEALRMEGTADSSKERLLSPERTAAGMALHNGYYYCLIAAGAEKTQASKWAVRLGLGMDSPSVDTAGQALNQAIERLARHGY